MNRKGKNYRLSPSFSDDLDKRINELEKMSKMIGKLHNIMKTIKANGLYSESEMQKDLKRMDVQRANEDEKQLICECWYIRKLANKKLMNDTKILVKDLKILLKEERT